MGFDPWLFNENNGQVRWKSISEDYYSFFDKTIKNNNKLDLYNFDKFQQLISISYFQRSIKELPKIISGESNPIPTLSQENTTNTRLLDGTISYSNKHRLATQVVINQRAKDFINNVPIYSLGEYNEFSSNLVNQFKDLIDVIQNNNINLVFFLTPYHPMVYVELKEKYPLVHLSEQYINELATKKNIQVLGSFNPTNLQMDETYFYDGIHCKEVGIEKILQNLERD